MSENATINNIIDQLKTLNLLQASELVKEIEIVFGVDASASVSIAASPLAGVPAAAVEQVEEKTSFDLTLTEVPADKKIAILKVVRSVTGFGLKESKDIVDNVPKLLKEGLTKEESEKIKKEIEELGGKVTIK